MTGQSMKSAARICIHVAVIPIILILAGIVGWTAGDYHWPYVVDSIELEPDPVTPGASLQITSVRQYLDDCDLAYERQLESVDKRDYPPVMMTAERGRTPWRFNGKPQTVKVFVPLDFPCGSAQLRTRPSASCNWMQVGWLRQRTRDVLTPFEVSCRATG